MDASFLTQQLRRRLHACRQRLLRARHLGWDLCACVRACMCVKVMWTAWVWLVDWLVGWLPCCCYLHVKKSTTGMYSSERKTAKHNGSSTDRSSINIMPSAKIATTAMQYLCSSSSSSV